MSAEYVCLAGVGIPPAGCGSFPGNLPVLDAGFHHPGVKDERQDLEHHPAYATRGGHHLDCEKSKHYFAVYISRSAFFYTNGCHVFFSLATRL